MSNSNNLGKELKRLRKEVEELKNRGRGFHYVVVGKTATAQERIDAMLADGSMREGDEYMVVELPWVISPLKGATHVPEGNSTDPFADPYKHGNKGDGDGDGMGASPSGSPLDPPPFDQQERWRQHERRIEADGTRFDPDKPKPNRGIY